MSTDVSDPNSSFCFAHWRYYSRGGGRIDFVSADQAAQERSQSPDNADRLLTFCETDKALLWFYLFVTQELDGMKLARPDLWKYANASKQRLGWRNNE
jgi:hypothetical protein